jgi:hypothetical protein
MSALPRIRSSVALMAALSAAIGLAPGAPTTAAAPPCKAKVVATGRVYAGLQTAVGHATKGGTVEVRGICVGSTTIGKDLVVVGVTTAATGTPTLSGGGTQRVVHVLTAHKVTFRSLTVTGGHTEGVSYPDNAGAAMLLDGTAVLKDVIVRGNHAVTDGAGAGGVEITVGARLVLAGATVMRGNSGGWGGAIENYGSLVVQDHARLHHNHALDGGGAIYSSPPAGSSTVLRGHARVDHNSAPDGGGIYHAGGALVLTGASLVDSNTATTGTGGGIQFNGGTITGATCGTRVKLNTPTDIAPSCT